MSGSPDQEEHLTGWSPWKPRRSTQRSCTFRVSLCRDQHIPAVLGSQLMCCSHVPDPRNTSQSWLASGMCRTNSHYTDPCHSLDTLGCATCTSTHFVVWNTGAIGTQLELGGDNDTRNVPKYVSICSQSSSSILHYIMVTRRLTHTFSFHIKYQVYLSGWQRQLFQDWSITLQYIKIKFWAFVQQLLNEKGSFL